MSKNHPDRSFSRGALLALLVFVLVSVLTAGASSAGSAKFCISGNSTGQGWSIGVQSHNPDGGVWYGIRNDCPGVPAGSGPAALAAAFVDCINDKGMDIIRAAVDPANPACFTITSGEVNIDLHVGPAGGNPTNQVTPAGVPFNPMIFRLGSNPYPADNRSAIACEVVRMLLPLMPDRRLPADHPCATKP